ncbi:MAG: caspase family protein [Hyphomicrobiales bacterium]|nr:caspase family protein [Hyphomicrobiales bacterium]
MPRFRQACRAVLCLAAGALALPGTAGAAESIQSLMTGASVELSTPKGFAVHLHPRPGGEIELRINPGGTWKSFTGKWWVKEDRFCFQVPDAKWGKGQVKCPKVVQDGGQVSFRNKTGDTLPWTYVRGQANATPPQASRSAAAAPPPDALPKGEVAALMTDTVLTLVNKKGQPISLTFRAGGAVEFLSRADDQDNRFPGVWFALPGRFCFQIPQAKVWQGEKKCPQVKKDGDKVTLISGTGEVLPWTLARAEPPPAPVAVAAAPPARATQASATPLRDSGKWWSDIEFGGFHALVIGNNAYRHLPPLKTAIGDAQAVARVLGREYGFTVHLLLDATRRDILKKFAELRKTLTGGDNLLIYYAGHGILDSDAERGYWLPVDADEDIKDNWVSNVDITDSLKAMQAWHVLVVADSCYSGTLVRSGPRVVQGGGDRAQLVRRLALKKSRTVLTSGGIEPVVDSGGSGHSVFAKAFMDTLRENTDVLEGQEIFLRLRQKVVLNADQTPEYADVRKAGHDGGDFVFVRNTGK